MSDTITFLTVTAIKNDDSSVRLLGEIHGDSGSLPSPLPIDY